MSQVSGSEYKELIVNETCPNSYDPGSTNLPDLTTGRADEFENSQIIIQYLPRTIRAKRGLVRGRTKMGILGGAIFI